MPEQKIHITGLRACLFFIIITRCLVPAFAQESNLDSLMNALEGVDILLPGDDRKTSQLLVEGKKAELFGSVKMSNGDIWLGADPIGSGWDSTFYLIRLNARLEIRTVQEYQLDDQKPYLLSEVEDNAILIVCNEGNHLDAQNRDGSVTRDGIHVLKIDSTGNVLAKKTIGIGQQDTNLSGFNISSIRMVGDQYIFYGHLSATDVNENWKLFFLYVDQNLNLVTTRQLAIQHLNQLYATDFYPYPDGSILFAANRPTFAIPDEATFGYYDSSGELRWLFSVLGSGESRCLTFKLSGGDYQNDAPLTFYGVMDTLPVTYQIGPAGTLRILPLFPHSIPTESYLNLDEEMQLGSAKMAGRQRTLSPLRLNPDSILRIFVNGKDSSKAYDLKVDPFTIHSSPLVTRDSEGEFIVFGPNLEVIKLDDSGSICTTDFQERPTDNRNPFELNRFFLDSRPTQLDSFAFESVTVTQASAHAAIIELCSVSCQIEVQVPTTVCQYDSVQAKITTMANDLNYWFLNDSLLANQAGLSYQAADHGIDTLILFSLSTSTGCFLQDTFLIDILPALDPTIRGPEVICPGSEDVDYVIENAGGLSWNWLLDGQPLDSNTSEIVIHAADTLNQFQLSAYPEPNNTACPVDTLRKIGRTDTLLTPSINGASHIDICAFDRSNQVYSSEFTLPGSAINWQISSGSILGENGLDSIVVSWESPGTLPDTGMLWFREEIQSASAFCAGFSDSLEVIILPSPDSSRQISGPDYVCEDSTAIFTFSINSESKVNWYSEESLSKSSPDTVVLHGTGWETTVIQAVETNRYGCRGIPARKIVRQEDKPLPEWMVADSTICLDNYREALYQVLPTAGSDYLWSVSGGSIISQDQSQSIRVSWDIDTARNLWLRERSSAGCRSEPIHLTIDGDLNSAYIANVSVDRLDSSTVIIDYRLGSTSGGTTDLSLLRRTVGSENDMWTEIKYLPERTSGRVEDVQVETWKAAFEYRIDFDNACGGVNPGNIENTLFLEATSIGNQVELRWNPYLSESRTYEILEFIDGQQETTWQTDDHILTLENNPRGFSQCYYVRAFRSPDTVSYSNPACVYYANELQIPNLITSNGDGVNEKWEIKNLQFYPDHQLIIYNRWGKALLETRDYQQSWTAESGYYFYELSIPALSPVAFTGWIQVIR